MKDVITTLFLICMLMSTTYSKAQQPNTSPSVGDVATASPIDEPGSWFKYFDGEYADIDFNSSRFGYGTDKFPVTYNIAIRLDGSSPEVAGKAVRKIAFPFGSLEYIENVKVWVSSSLPTTAQDAEVCIALDKTSLLAGEPTIVEFPEPYKVKTKEVYVGYEFQLTNEKDICPVVIDKHNNKAKPNAYLINFNNSWWSDLVGQTSGNPAISVFLGEVGMWYQRFNGKFSDIDMNVNRFGYGSDSFPVTYNAAIKVDASDPVVKGKMLKKFAFIFSSLEYIDNVKVWISKQLPATAEEADICCYSLDKSVVLEGSPTVFEFPTPYPMGSEDVYIGYEFITTSVNDYNPVIVDDITLKTDPGTFYLNYQNIGWGDKSDCSVGHLAAAVGLEEPVGAEFNYYDETAGYSGRFGYACDEFPVPYQLAIKLRADNPDVGNKVLRKISFMLHSLDYIEDVKVWVSTRLPGSAELASVCCYPIDKASINAGKLTVFELPEPYTIHNDIYVGYEFYLTSEQDICPVMLDSRSIMTKHDAFNLKFAHFAWENFRNTMNGNLIISTYLEKPEVFGDANYDGATDVLDVSVVTDYILNGSSDYLVFQKADIDRNGEINIVDAESILDIILDEYKAPVKNMDAYAYDMLNVEKTYDGYCVNLMAGNSYRGYQMDVVLPDGAGIESLDFDASLKATHSIRYTHLDGNRYRVVVSSINGNDMTTDSMLNIVSSSKDMKIENIVFSTSDLQVKRFESISIGDVTSINNAEAEKTADEVYDLNGMRVDKPQKGVYIVNGKKVIMK